MAQAQEQKEHHSCKKTCR